MTQENREKIKANDLAINYLHQFLLALAAYVQAWFFVKEHKPWKGLREYGWLVKIVGFAAILLGLGFCINLLRWFSSMGSSDSMTMQAGMLSFFNDFAWENVKWVFKGGSKYIILVLLEILVFHFTRYTLDQLTGAKSDASFNAFVDAEIRMIKVAFRSWILEIITIGILGIVLGILGMKGWKPFFGFFVQCYFVGFAMIDNYFECFGASIKESSKMIWEVAGASVGIGMIAYLLMFIPIVGVVAATGLGAVAATIIMYKLVPPDTIQLQEATETYNFGQPN